MSDEKPIKYIRVKVTPKPFYEVVSIFAAEEGEPPSNDFVYAIGVTKERFKDDLADKADLVKDVHYEIDRGIY